MSLLSQFLYNLFSNGNLINNETTEPYNSVVLGSSWNVLKQPLRYSRFITVILKFKNLITKLIPNFLNN